MVAGRTGTGRKRRGLGLALVRQVAVAHGGSVQIESKPDRGTRVSVRLPLEESAARAKPVVTRY